MTCFLGIMIVGIVTLIVALPSITLGTAQLFSQLGALDGDPLGTPGYFTPLLLLILVITCYLFVGILSWLGITLAYQYGSYKVQDEEKEKINKHINIESTK